MSDIKGLDELLATLSGLGGDIRQACYKGIIRGAKTIQKNAKLLCPVDTGQLRNSIKTRGEIKQDIIKAQVYTNSGHSAYVEFGTGQRGASSHIQKPEGADIHYNFRWMGQKPQPYLTPAYLHAKNSGEVEKQLAKAIEQEIRKLGGK
jgi:HK97 gp10 family phage protein